MLSQKQLNNFMAKVSIDSTSLCWIWTAATAGRGYGVFRLNNPRRQDYAHKIAYREWRGEIPAGYIVHHKCENVRCVNPVHLETVTQSWHMLQHKNDDKGNFCSQGHDLSKRGSLLPKAGRKNGRVCLECAKTNTRRWREKNKASRVPKGELTLSDLGLVSTDHDRKSK